MQGKLGSYASKKSLARVAYSQRASVWGELTARGADEAHAAGLRLERWLAETGEGIPSEEGAGTVTRVLVGDSRHALLTAKALLSGLCLPNQRVNVDNSPILRLGDCVDDDSSQESKEDVILELAEGLNLSPAELADASWPRLLDVAEAAATFGLLPHGELTDSARMAISSAPQRQARALVSAANQRLGRLARFVLAPCMKALHEEGHAERLRVAVLPGFSLMCLATLWQLGGGASLWPKPASGLLLETLVDEEGKAFLRFWQPKDFWEVRPSWHEGEGPVQLMRLLEMSQRSSE